MKHQKWVKAALVLAGILGGARTAGAAEGLSLRRVMLSTGGVGYFEYEARVSGEARLPLTVRLDQVDDVLKSVIVYDSKGNQGEITLAGKDMVKETFRDLPFDKAALNSPWALFEALKGSQVRAEIDGRTIAGRLVSVNREDANLTGGTTVERHRITIESAGTVKQVLLEDARSIRFVDPRLQKQLEAALGALSGGREKGPRELSIHIKGEGERLVRVAYIAEAPLWKSTYRMTLPDETQAKTARLEGFAVVENRSGKDWKGVDLTLLSGNPVTFRQALYQAYYVDRPEVPVDMVKRVLPTLDEGATPTRHVMRRRRASGAPMMLDGAGMAAGFAGEAEEAEEIPMAPPETAESRQATTQATFHLRAPVTIGNGQSALLPVLVGDLPADRWSLYQAETDKDHPLSTIRLLNNTATDLPPGALSIYERGSAGGPLAYVGDARLTPLPRGEERTVSFAVDQRVLIHKDEQSAQMLSVARIINGSMSLSRIDRQTTVYTLKGAADEPRTLVVEQRIPTDWKVVGADEGGAQPFEQKGDIARFIKALSPGEDATLTVILEHAVIERVGISALSDDQIAAWISGTTLTPQVRAAMEGLRSLRATVAERQAALSSREAEQKQIVDDQARIRENLKVVPAGSDLAKGYLATLTAEETRLHALGDELKAARQALAQAKRELAAYVSRLNVG